MTHMCIDDMGDVMVVSEIITQDSHAGWHLIERLDRHAVLARKREIRMTRQPYWGALVGQEQPGNLPTRS